MTVKELIEELQKIVIEGKGDYSVVDGDYGEVIGHPYVTDSRKEVII